MRKTNWSYCKATGKRRLRSENDAEAALRSAKKKAEQWRKKGEHMRQEQRYYICEFCEGWHLTSKDVQVWIPFSE